MWSNDLFEVPPAGGSNLPEGEIANTAFTPMSVNQISLADQNRSKIVYAVLLLISLVWLGVIFAAPILLKNGYVLTSLVIYQSLSAVCHQMPDRSIHIGDLPLGVCSRCTGIYAGFVTGLLCYPLLRSLRSGRMPSRRWLMMAAVPAVIDFGGGFTGLFNNTFLSRAATGGLLGAVAAFYILPGFVSIFREFSTEMILWRKLITKNLP